MTGPNGAVVMRLVAAIIAPLFLLGLAGCSDTPGKSGNDRPANPLVYELASADGKVEGWMLGTIHALPPGTEWRTPVINKSVDDADLLVVEVKGLGDADVAQTFSVLSVRPGLAPIDKRVPSDLAAPLADLLARGNISPERFASTETWAAAIALARIDAAGDPASGVDRALLDDFAARPIRELEGVAGQLSIFDRLPEVQQRAMLTAVVRESVAARSDPQRLQRAWLTGDAAAIEASTHESFLAEPALREALLTGRNERWAKAIIPLLEKSPRPLIAVGTAHLVGPEGLVALLEARGYRVRRIP